VPVSKISISNSDLIRWSEGKEATAETAKGLLYTGTKVVRVRGNAIGGMESPATGLVVRTAFHTTKGALVRSMLFPKPMGFKFYRDSMRFIAVLAGIAGLGFLISAFQFVRLGVSDVSCASAFHSMLDRSLSKLLHFEPSISSRSSYRLHFPLPYPLGRASPLVACVRRVSSAFRPIESMWQGKSTLSASTRLVH